LLERVFPFDYLSPTLLFIRSKDTSFSHLLRLAFDWVFALFLGWTSTRPARLFKNEFLFVDLSPSPVYNGLFIRSKSALFPFLPRLQWGGFRDSLYDSLGEHSLPHGIGCGTRLWD